MVQDSKHAAKTLRNNIFSGARALVLGNHLAMYSHVRDMAFSNLTGCPLYHQDVEKVDKQDDNATTRLFSALALDFVVKEFPDRCQSHSTLQLPMCYERLLALSNPCWTLPVGCSLVHRGQIESTINLHPANTGGRGWFADQVNVG